jgi:hypothetical protein
MDLQSNYGYTTLLAIFFTNLMMIAAYVVIIDKAKKILDYVLTNFFIHLIITTLNSHFPFNPIWWIVNGVFLTIVTLISEFIALKLDQRDIKLDLNFGDAKNNI